MVEVQGEIEDDANDVGLELARTHPDDAAAADPLVAVPTEAEDGAFEVEDEPRGVLNHEVPRGDLTSDHDRDLGIGPGGRDPHFPDLGLLPEPCRHDHPECGDDASADHPPSLPSLRSLRTHSVSLRRTPKFAITKSTPS